MNNLINFNINNNVHVKLTRHGVEVMRSNHEEMRCTLPFMEKETDEEGYSVWQMWELMGMFGSNITMGLELPFNTDIKLEQLESNDE
jgi:hypothetical protein